MFKRFVARVLIFFQIYSSLFQGIAYGGYGLLENLPIQDEIYLHGGYAKDGGLRLSLWTSTLTSQKTELLKEIEIPTYEEVKARSRTNSRASSPSPALQLPTSNLSPPSISDSFPSQTPPSSFSPLPDAQQPTEIFSDQDSVLAALTDQEDMSDEENSAFESEEGILRTPEGAHFSIQGLKVFLSNSGELLVQGKQEDFSHPILLSSDRSIILHEVEAFALKLTSGSIISVGESKIDFLSLEGSADDSTIMPQFLNQGTLTAKSVFLKNLNNANNGRLTTDTIEIPEGVFENLGNLRVKEKMTLNAERFTNRGIAAISTLHVLDSVRRLENAENAELEFMQPVYLPPSTATVNEGFMKGSIQSQGTIFNQGFLEGDFLKTSEALTNRGILRSRNIEADGPSFEQTGTITARRLQIGHDTQIITSATQKLELTEAIESHSQSPWTLEGTVITSTFSHLGRLELLGELITEQFEGHGIINERGRLKAQESRFTDATTILGRTTLQHLDASGDVIVQGIVTVRDQATIGGRLYVREKGMLKGKKTKTLTLKLQEGGEIAGLVDVDYLSATKPLTLAAKGKLVSRVRTNLFADLLIPAEASAELHYLSSHSKLKNEGNLSIIGVRPGSRLQLINRGSAQVDAGHTLSINSTGNSALFEPDIVLEETRTAQRALAMVDPNAWPEVFTNLNLMPSDATCYTPYKEKFKKFLQATSEGQEFIHDVLNGDINNVPDKFLAFRQNDLIRKYKTWFRQRYEIPAEMTEIIVKRVIKGVDEVSPDPRSCPEIFLDKNSYPNALNYALYKQKFKDFLQITEEGRLFIQEKLDSDINKLPCKFSIFIYDNTVEKYRDWYREHYEIPAQIAERIKQKIEERKLAANSAKFVPDIVLEETRAAQRALAMVDPNAWPEVFTNSYSFPQTTREFYPYIQNLKNFFQSTVEGRQFVQEVLGGDINKMPSNMRDLAINSPLKKYQIWFHERYEIPTEITEKIAERIVTEVAEEEPNHLSRPEVFIIANPFPRAPIELRGYVQNLKNFFQSTTEGQKFIQEELGGDINRLPSNCRDLVLNDPIKKYQIWFHQRYEIQAQIAKRIKQKIEERKLAANSAKFVPDIVLEETRAAQRALAMVDPNAWPEVFTSVNPDPRSSVKKPAQAANYTQKLKEFFQSTAEGKQFVQEVLGSDINSIPSTPMELARNDPIKKYQIWFRGRYENQEIMAPEIIKKAITGEFDITLDPRALPEIFTASNSLPRSVHQLRAYVQNLKTFLQATEIGRQFIRDELGDNFEKMPTTPQDCSFNSPIEKYRVWLQARYNTLIQTSQRIREKIDTHQSAQEQWQRQLSSTIDHERPIWIEGVNHPTGQLTLKSGRFDFTDAGAFVNEGTLVQEQAAVHWLAKASEDFNTGTWRVKGSLQLDNYRSENLGVLEVNGTLGVTTPDDAMEAFKGLAKVKTQRLVMHAPSLRDVTPEDKILPWVLELHLAQDFETKAKMTTGPLELFCKGFKPGGKLFTQQLDLVSELADLNIDSIVFGRDYIRLATDRLSIDGRVVLPGKACPNILYTRSGSGFHSEGPVMLDVKEHWRNYYGTISASYYQLTGPSLANTAGYIEGRDETQKSFLRMARIEHTRDAQGSYTFSKHFGYYQEKGKTWCRPHGSAHCNCGGNAPVTETAETSDEAVITHKGDLELVYDSLDVMVSQITSAKALTFIAQGHVKEIGDAFDHHLGTRSQERNGKKPQIRSRHFQGDLGSTLLAGTLRAESVAIMAANMTLQNMQLPSAQKGAVVRIVEQLMRPGHSKLYELTDAGYDTVIPWAQKQVPHSIALVGKDAESLPETFGTQFTFRALENIMGPLFLDLYRGVSYLGLSLDLLMAQAVEFVRVQKGTTTTIHRIQDGDTTREIEVVKNPDITMEDLKKSGIPMVLMEFVKNLNRVEDDLKATKYAEDLKKIAVEACAIFPAEKDARSGIFAEKAPANIDITEGNFTSIGSVVSAHGGFINVPNGRADFLAHAVTVGDANNYYQVLNRPEIENLGVKSEGEKHVFELGTRDGIKMQGAILTAADKDSLLDIETQGMYDDQAAYIQSRQTTFSSTKKTSTTTIIDRSIAQSSEYNGKGMVAVKSSMGIVMQAPTLNTTTNLLAPSVAFTEAHDAISVQTITEKKGKRKWYGASGASKTTQESMRSWLSKGVKIKGKLHVNTNKAHCVNPTISRGAEVVIHASETIDIAAGVNQSDYQMQSTYKGAVWTKQRMTQESRTTHVNPRIDGNMYFYTPKARVQQRAGSGPIANITSDVPIDYVDMIDQHHYTSKSQKSLSAGAAMIVRLGVALLVANPFAGGGLSSTMAGAGFDTLCSEAAVNMIESDGNPGRALQAMREKNIVKTVARSVAAAGLTGTLGAGTAPTSVEGFAKEFLARSAVSTTMAIAFDGVKPGDAIRQGALNAAVQTVGACIANKIGDMADSKMGTEQIGDITQEIFHGFLGAGIGAGTAAIMGQDIGKGATSGAIGAVVGHSTAKISSSKALGDLVAVAVAMMTDQDVGIAYMASNNATTYNFNRHKANPIEGLVKAVKEGMQPQEGENVSQEQADYMQGRDEYVNKALEKASQQRGGYLSAYEINHVIETASNMYAYKYTADKMQALAGQTVVKGAEILIPGMQGINQAWMGVVNHARGELPAGALANEVISGIESSLIDGALAVVTLGVSNYYRTAKVAVGTVKAAATLEAGSVALSPKAKIYLDRKLFQEHHIISNKSKYTRNHELLELAGFDLNSSANKMFLPTRSGANISTTSRSIHEGRHLESVSQSLARQMDEIVKIGPTFSWGPPQYHNELMQILSKERTALKSGDRILNTHHRPWATNGVGGNLK